MTIQHKALLRASMAAWPAAESHYLAGWYLRASPDPTKRTNAVWPVEWDDGNLVVAMIEQAEAWYRERGKPPLFQVNSVASPACLDRLLQERGYRAFDHSVVEVLALSGLPAQDPRIEIETRASPSVMNAIMPRQANASTRAARAKLFGTIRKPLAFAIGYDNEARKGDPVAGGMIVVDGDLAGVFAMHTHPRSRGKGLASAVLNALCQWAHRFGAKHAYLQVELANHVARQFYKRRGFQTVLDYHYRIPSSFEN